MPTQKNSSARIGVTIIAAINRGRIKYWIGLTAIDSSASICSEIRIVPSSVAMPEPARPASISAHSTGPSSIASALPVVPPANDSRLNCLNA